MSGATDESHKTTNKCANCQSLCTCCSPRLVSDDKTCGDTTAIDTSITKNNDNIVLKRRDAIQWDDYFMAISFLSAMRSKDPSTQVGACIVNKDRRIVGIGYNGFPRGCSD